MAFLLRDLCLFSEVKGVVLHHGKPVANAEVERIHDWKKPKSEIVKTDEQGRFSFPMAVGRSLLAPLLPFENVIIQMVMIRHNNNTYKAWMSSKRDFDVNSELERRPIIFLCDLESNPEHHKEKHYGIGTLVE